ncbi:MAG: hypothetical protein JO353_02125, partial [Phycisphaerae bacterium]|nr:hypothetical protein [Phycisphaerae bacterium]
MDKVTKFLEEYVEWIAVGLGALFVGYTVWAYALQTPVTVTGIGGSQPLDPSEVDKKIQEGPAQQLHNAMEVTTIPEMNVPDFVAGFKSDMGEADYKPTALAWFPDSPTFSEPIVASSHGPAKEEKPIKELAVLSPAKILDYSTGRSNVQLAAAPAGGAAGGNGAQPVGNTSDVAWVTVRYSISPSQIADAFAKANVPAWTNRTAILQIQLYRQEELPNGKWSDPKLIDPLNKDSLTAFPASGNAQGEQEYVTWADNHITDLMQPAFLTVNKGDPWTMPGQQPANNGGNTAAPVAQAPLDPSKDYPINVLLQYSVEERKAYAKAKEELKAKAHPPVPRNTGTPSGGGTGASPYIKQSSADHFLPFAAPIDNPPPGQSPRLNASNANAFGQQPPAAVDNPGAPAGDQNPGAAPTAAGLPSGEFDPKSVNSDLIGWAHDITAQPGHSYR